MGLSSSHVRILLLVLVSLAVGFAAITHQSFWMDEGSVAFKALMPSVKEWWKMSLTLRGSDVQMPAYTLAVWGWEKFFGNSEFALRAINLPFLVIAALALRHVRFWPMVCLTSPFVLYYVGELRPYAMQIAGAACAAAALGTIMRSPRGSVTGIHGLMGSALLLCLASLTSVVWAFGLLVAVIIARPDWLTNRRFWMRSLLWSFPFLALGGYYVFTLLEGYRATVSGGGGLLSMLFGFYEIAGLLGLGPSRNELRLNPSVLLRHLPWLIPATAVLTAAWLLGFRAWINSTPRRMVLAVATAVILPLVTLAIVGQLADFRVLGRHLSPAVPAVLLPFCLCLGAIPQGKIPCLTAGLAILVSVTSFLFLRFDPRHARDDYRDASLRALDAVTRGKAVLWQADMNTPRYYAYRHGGVPALHTIQTLESDPPSGYIFADMVFINRPDIGYRGQDHRKTMRQNAFELDSSLTGFEIWRNRYSD